MLKLWVCGCNSSHYTSNKDVLLITFLTFKLVGEESKCNLSMAGWGMADFDSNDTKMFVISYNNLSTSLPIIFSPTIITCDFINSRFLFPVPFLFVLSLILPNVIQSLFCVLNTNSISCSRKVNFNYFDTLGA